MLVRTLHMRREQYIITIKKKKKIIYGTATKDDLKELSEEGIDVQMIPWIEDSSN